MSRHWIPFVYLTCMVVLVYSHRHHHRHQQLNRNKKLGALVGDRKTLLPLQQPPEINVDKNSSSGDEPLFPINSDRAGNVNEELRFDSKLPVSLQKLNTYFYMFDVLETHKI